MTIKKKYQRVNKLKKPKPCSQAGKGRKKEFVSLVRAGVERFILKDATIDDFLKTMRSAARKETAYSHQLTRSVFSRIVKEAVRKRKRQLRKSVRP